MENYSFQRVLATSKSEKTVLCTDKRTNLFCVVHEISLSGIPEEEWNSVLEEEIVFTQLNHPNILRHNEAFVKSGTLYRVTDYAQGGSLETKIEKAQGMLIDESVILDWFAKICLAVKYCHDRNVLHRDIQAKNVVFLRNGMLKISGFVNSKILLGTTNFTQTAQTAPFFFAPEICQGKNYSSKTEIWAIGCLLYQLCAQRPPFEAPSVTVLIRKILKGQLAQIPYIYSSNLRNLVSSMLSKHPSRRPNINKILVLDFMRSELHNIHDVTMDNFGTVIKSKKRTKGKAKNQAKHGPKSVTKIKAKHNSEMKKEFNALELNSTKKEKEKQSLSKELSTTMRFDGIKIEPLPDDDKVDELKERIRKRRDEIREQIFRSQHPELFVEDGEECPPPVNPNLSDLIHLSSDSDSEDEFVELAAIAQSIFEDPPKNGEEKVVEPSNEVINSSFFTGVALPSLPIPNEKSESSTTYRIEEIRDHLEKTLGFDTFAAAYEIVKHASDDTKQEQIEERLRKVLTTDELFSLYPLIQHLCILEESVYEII